MKTYVFSFRTVGINAERVVITVEASKGEGVTTNLPDEMSNFLLNNVFASIDRPDMKIDVNIAPFDASDGFRRYELPVALGILAASREDSLPNLDKYIIAGELNYGDVGYIFCDVQCAELAKSLGKGCILPEDSSKGAATAIRKGVSIMGIRSVDEAIRLVKTNSSFDILMKSATPYMPTGEEYDIWTNDVYMSDTARLSAKIIAAGGHPAFVSFGARGSFSQMVSYIMPDLTDEERVECNRQFSIHGYSVLFDHRPHRDVGSAGYDTLFGNYYPKRGFVNGELALAHNGVMMFQNVRDLYTDTLEKSIVAYKDKSALAEDNEMEMRYPTDFLPLFGEMENFITERLINEDLARAKWRRSVLLSSMLSVATLQVGLNGETASKIENVLDVRAQVTAARQKQMERQGALNNDASFDVIENSLAKTKKACNALKDFAVTTIAERGLRDSAYEPVVRMARTIADLNGNDYVSEGDITTACGFRYLDDKRLF